MKLRNIFLAGMALCSFSLFAQTHVEGIEYYKADQFNNAEELLKRNYNNAGTDQALSDYYLGQIAFLRGNTSEAKSYFDKGIQTDPNNPYNYIGLGYMALKSGDLKTAEKYFKDAESKDKKNQSVQIEIARAYFDVDPVKYKDKYEKRISNAIKNDITNPDIYILRGDILRQEAYLTKDPKTYGKAAAEYDMATSNDPSSAVAYVKYADMYMQSENPQYAISKLEELISNNPNSALGQRELANAYYENKQYQKAVAQYGKYVQNPSHFKSDEDQYAFLLFADGDYQQGYEYATSLLQGNPNNFTALRFQFMNAAQLKDMEDQWLPMAENLLAIHKANPENKFAAIDYTLITEELTKAGRYDEAIALINEGIREIPNNPSFYKTLSNVYLGQEDYSTAADTYAEYINQLERPGYNDLIQGAVYAYFAGLTKNDTKYYDMAESMANEASEVYPEMYKPYKVLGDVQIQRATDADAPIVAFDNYSKALELLGDTPDPRYNNDLKAIYRYLGIYYAEQKDKEQAKSYLNKYLEINPDDAQIRTYVNKL